MDGPANLAPAGFVVAAALMLVLEWVDVRLLGVVRPPSPGPELLVLASIALVVACSVRRELARLHEAAYLLVAVTVSWRDVLYATGSIDHEAGVEVLVGQTILCLFGTMLAPSVRAFVVGCTLAVVIPIGMHLVGPTAGVLGPRALAYLPITVAAMLPVGWGLQVNRRAVAAALQEAEDLASRDPLTGLANRRSFLDVVARVLAPPDAPAALLVLDLDGFKELNDHRGHAEGDRVLCCVAGRMRRCLRPGDRLARIGGEEFAVLLETDAPETARFVAERLRLAIDADEDCDVTVSVGVAVREPGEGFEALFRRADRALYEAKAAGRNRIVAA